ncbi:hypothetical protein KC331_g6286 [Hortaea werneckii]|uniref:F-box domain-containing protein n=1 Tax=Hortaea werneckii TaxID=91943 RepID=A0A3M7CXU7_HORWE|nr:hypothetical protein KC354_g4419 [Hortaea werneckii]KAI7545305.1 hypothetical protein KC331_g6286 [Hortaea werneckii]KAI7720119.1 hypothetical protein KC353_g2443 [Hortaea werneckii]RMY56567.1 hypothetical protein D0865_03581 [Hortaea werneckii]
MTPDSPSDPLSVLPPEIVLRILDFTPIDSLASLTATTKAWHAFIDEKHQDAIYSSPSKTQHPLGARDFDFLKSSTSFAKFFEGTSSWKDLCKRQTLLPRNWHQEKPVTKESVVQVGNDPVWRFRPDFKRRIFLSTSQAGGLNVTCMDTGKILWRLPSTLETDAASVRPYAHLEYQDGTAVFDREGDAVEVWRHDDSKAFEERGEFKMIAVLPHDCQTRGFQLSHKTLVVVSTQGQGFVYDFSVTPPTLRTRLEIEDDAVGHLDQDAEMVMYSMGARGYHVYDKTTGKFVGAVQPWKCAEENRYHILHPDSSTAPSVREARHGPTPRTFPPSHLSKTRLVPLKLQSGALPFPHNDEHFPLEEDEWGAGMLCGNVMAGVSRHGRVFICSDWRKYLQVGDGKACASVVECESDGSSFDLGGWLSVRKDRVMFEIQDRVYVLALQDDGSMQDPKDIKKGSYSLLTSSAPQLAVPVSFMGLYDDCIIHTYTTLGWRQRTPALAAHHGAQHRDGPARIFPTKAIRAICLAPDLDGEEPKPELWQPEPEMSAADQAQTGLLQLVSMLGDELDDDDDDIGAMGVDFQEEDEWEDESDREDPANHAPHST